MLYLIFFKIKPKWECAENVSFFLLSYRMLLYALEIVEYSYRGIITVLYNHHDIFDITPLKCNFTEQIHRQNGVSKVKRFLTKGTSCFFVHQREYVYEYKGYAI